LLLSLAAKVGSCAGVASPSAPEVFVETITIAASRSSFSLPEMEMLVASAVVVALLAWAVLARMRRDRHSPAAQK
jgi:hypothetical protein